MALVDIVVHLDASGYYADKVCGQIRAASLSSHRVVGYGVMADPAQSGFLEWLLMSSGLAKQHHKLVVRFDVPDKLHGTIRGIYDIVNDAVRGYGYALGNVSIDHTHRQGTPVSFRVSLPEKRLPPLFDSLHDYGRRSGVSFDGSGFIYHVDEPGNASFWQQRLGRPVINTYGVSAVAVDSARDDPRTFESRRDSVVGNVLRPYAPVWQNI